MTTGAPIYLQIVRRIKADIATGVLAPAAKLPSVREAAEIHRVNHNTMHRVMRELEREDIIEAQRGIGYFVVANPAVADGLRHDEAAAAAEEFVARIHALGPRRRRVPGEPIGPVSVVDGGRRSPAVPPFLRGFRPTSACAVSCSSRTP